MHDYLIIGAGIIGLTIAWELTRRFPGANILIIEKEGDVAQHASGRNSGVLHAGFYYSADSLKARFCVEGNRRMKAFCREHGLPLTETGKVVVAQNEAEVDLLRELMRRGERNGVELELIDQAQLKTIEPNAKTFRQALYSPGTAAVDPVAVCQKLKALLAGKVAFRFHTRVRRVGDHTVFAENFTAKFRYLINCAGLYADKIAHQMGVGKEFVLLPFKGLYLQYDGDPGEVRTNIYPVPDIRNPFLGVHFTKTVAGAVKIGPTAIPAFWREHYQGLANFRFREFAEVLRWEARLLLQNRFNFRRLALQEMRKYRPGVMIREARRLVHRIGDRFHPLPPGIRAQLLDTATGKLVMDFVVRHSPNATHVLNAVSPAFTCAFSFAEYLVNEAVQNQRSLTKSLHHP